MDQLKTMKEMLIGCVQGQMTHLDTVDAKELGEAIDMIKDLSEAIYYCTITEAMEEKKENGGGNGNGNTMYYPVMYYTEGNTTDGRDASRGGRREFEEPYYRDMDRMKGRMYYDGSGNRGGTTSNSNGSSSGNSGSRNYTERERDLGEVMRDRREGRSAMSRKMYMESKEMHKDKNTQMQELDKYVQELTTDMVEMIQDASPEEKQLLSNRIATLATKIK